MYRRDSETKLGTSDPYERRLIAFLNRISMDPDSFVDLAKSKPQAAEKKSISYINEESCAFICPHPSSIA